MSASGKTAVVLGANGQDGTWLVRRLIERGYRVVGAGVERQARLPQDGQYTFRTIDLADAAAFRAFLDECTPAAVFHAAAVHASAATSSQLDYERGFQAMLAVNSGSVHTVLEHFRVGNREGRLVYLSSGKRFGPDYPQRVHEGSPKFRKCLYTITKGAAEDLILYYRARHGVLASVIYPFAHESELRPPEFFIPKLAAALADAIAGRKRKTVFFTLDFRADWGVAEEYMDICIDVAQRAIGQDLLLATGKAWLARDLARQAFARYGFDYVDFIECGGAADGAPASFGISTEGLKQAIGRSPQREILDLVCALAERDSAGA